MCSIQQAEREVDVKSKAQTTARSRQYTGEFNVPSKDHFAERKWRFSFLRLARSASYSGPSYCPTEHG